MAHYKMDESFSVDNLKAFCEAYLAGSLTPKIKEEPDYSQGGGDDYDECVRAPRAVVVLSLRFLLSFFFCFVVVVVFFFFFFFILLLLARPPGESATPPTRPTGRRPVNTNNLMCKQSDGCVCVCVCVSRPRGTATATSTATTATTQTPTRPSSTSATMTLTPS